MDGQSVNASLVILLLNPAEFFPKRNYQARVYVNSAHHKRERESEIHCRLSLLGTFSAFP
jgi:hypothetical protein